MVESFEYQSQVIAMTHSHTRMSSKVIQKYFDNWLEIVKIKVIAHWKVAPAFLRLKGIFRYANVPQGQINAVLCWSSGLICIWLYLENPSIKEKMTLLAQLSMIWLMCGVGKLSLGQALFKSRKLIQTLIVACFLATWTILDTHYVRGTGWINLAFRSFSTSALIVAAFLGWTWCSFCWTSLAMGCLNLVYNDGRINPRHFFVCLGKKISKLFE